MRKRGLVHLERTRGVPDENLPDFATLQRTRQHLFKARHFIAFEDNIRDPENHPFPTPSGKMRSSPAPLRHAASGNPGIYRTTFAHEGRRDALAKRFSAPVNYVERKKTARQLNAIR